MGERLRIVEVEVVNHVAVGQWMLRQQIDDVGPIRPGGDDRVARRSFANGRRGARLNAGPAIGIVHLRLIHHFEEDFLRIARGIVRGQLAPQHHEAVHASFDVRIRCL